MKTIAIIESCDTKHKEAAYLSGFVSKAGLKPLVIDVATGHYPSRNYDISREEVAASTGTPWSALEGKTKGEKISFMTDAVAVYVEKMYKAGKIDGVLSVGGMQNTLMATNAMKRLPLGVPKVMATTLASGQKKFEDVVGDKDIVTIPSICDFTGLNIVTKKIMQNAAACCIGMVKTSGKPIEKSEKKVVGVTLMGVTNTGACSAIEELEKNGIEAIGFHSTGVGGSIMEQMAADGLIDGILDLTTHELAEGYFGRGFSYGKDWKSRINKSIDNKIPLVVSTGGLDFCDFAVNEFPPEMDRRVYMMHNNYMAHIKLLPEEAEKVADDFCSRVERADYPVTVLIPTDGMRHNTRKGEELYDPKVDRIILDRVKKISNPNVRIETIEGNIDTEEWGIRAAHYMIDEMKKLQRN